MKLILERDQMAFYGRRPNPVFSEEYGALRQVLIAARSRSGLTQRALAARLGKARSHVARIEAGQRRVDALELYKIAQALQISPERLFRAICQRLQEHDALADRQVRSPAA